MSRSQQGRDLHVRGWLSLVAMRKHWLGSHLGWLCAGLESRSKAPGDGPWSRLIRFAIFLVASQCNTDFLKAGSCSTSHSSAALILISEPGLGRGLTISNVEDDVGVLEDELEDSGYRLQAIAN